LKDVYSKVLQYEVHRLFSNLRALVRLKKNGRKIGGLRFKGREWFKTITYNQSGFKIVLNGRRHQTLHLSKIGDIPIRMHRNLAGRIKQITIKRHRSEKWFACFTVKGEAKQARRKRIAKTVGIDLGVNHFAADSEGRFVEHPHFLNKTLKKLRREQRCLSRRKKLSKNRLKQRIKVARIHEKILNQRNDFLHKLSNSYIDRYDLIAVEDLNIKGLIGISFNARNIADSSWSRFLQMLSYKAERAGKTVVRVEARGTTQKCSGCGMEVKKSLSTRMHRCPCCGLEIDRDYNAALNILKLGLEKLPQELRESTPVEMEQTLSLKQEAPCESWE
jgi:transposase, IS605 OrfB family, central region